MDKLTSLNLTFDKVLIQFIIPGLIAIFPWFIFFLNSHPNDKSYFYNNSSITITAVTFLALIAGLFLENAGSRLEVLWLDKRNLATDSNYNEIWKRYLQLSYSDNEPIGQRYLRNILLRMKFELSTAIALVPMMIGLGFIDYYKKIFDNHIFAIILLYIVPTLIGLYLLLIEARSSSQALANTRKLLVDKYFK